jgi:hypothetical protein
VQPTFLDQRMYCGGMRGPNSASGKPVGPPSPLYHVQGSLEAAYASTRDVVATANRSMDRRLWVPAYPTRLIRRIVDFHPELSHL